MCSTATSAALKTKFFLAIERTLGRLVTDRIVVISPQQFREIHETFGVGRADQFAVVPLGIDLTVYDHWRQRRAVLRRELGAGDEDILVGIVGRLTEIKNHAMFLRVARTCLDQTALPPGRVRFVVIGDGHLSGRLEEQARSLNLKDNLVFLGNRNDPEHFYPALDIVALTSLNEGTPLTLIEAMANGRPVISTSVGGVVDLLGPQRPSGEPGALATGVARFSICQRGLSVASGDEEGFVSGLNHLINDSLLRRDFGDCGEQFIRANYSKQRLLADMARLYEELLTDGAAARRDEAPRTVDSGKQVMQCAS